MKGNTRMRRKFVELLASVDETIRPLNVKTKLDLNRTSNVKLRTNSSFCVSNTFKDIFSCSSTCESRLASKLDHKPVRTIGHSIAPFESFNFNAVPTLDSFVDANNTISGASLRAQSLLKASEIAQRLLTIMCAEIKAHGLLRDYIGYPYWDRRKTSAWDIRQRDGTFFVFGTHQALFHDALQLLVHDLANRGVIVHALTFREERIRYYAAQDEHHHIVKGIGFAWHLQ